MQRRGVIPEEMPANTNSGNTNDRRSEQLLPSDMLQNLRESRIDQLARAFVHEVQQEHDRQVRLDEFQNNTTSLKKPKDARSPLSVN